MIRGFCLACDRPLTGKQRKWCSERCRKAFDRASVNGVLLSENFPGLGVNGRDLSVFVREASEFSAVVVAVVEYDPGKFRAEYDNWSIKYHTGEQVKAALEQAMRQVNHRWVVEVACLKVETFGPEFHFG